MFKGKNPTSGHSVAELYVDGQWVIVDPHMNAVYRIAERNKYLIRYVF